MLPIVRSLVQRPLRTLVLKGNATTVVSGVFLEVYRVEKTAQLYAGAQDGYEGQPLTDWRAVERWPVQCGMIGAGQVNGGWRGGVWSTDSDLGTRCALGQETAAMNYSCI